MIKTPKRRRSSSRSKSQNITPKWVPVSQDSGALITEELSIAHSPIMNMENTPNIRRSPKKKKKSTTSKNRVTKKPPQTPKTPQDKINEEYEPRVTSGGSRRMKSKSKQITKSSKARAKEPEPINDYDNDDNDDDDDEEYAQEDAGGESDIEVDDLYQHGTTEVKISRLPTSSARLTSIDIVLQHLDDSLSNEHGKHFQTFQKLNKIYLNKILDLNLTNNYYIYKLRDLKNEKTIIRNDLFDKRQEINENLINLEKLRNKYNQLREVLLKRRKINENLENLVVPIKDDSILFKLNKLNNIIDPNWGILDKIRELNSKFSELDETN